MMIRNASKIFGANDFEVSPIGRAFSIVRNENPGIDLYSADSKHQSDYGSYLKACVNYLMIFRKLFQSQPADGATSSIDCGIPHDQAAYLRQVAERVVLGAR